MMALAAWRETGNDGIDGAPEALRRVAACRRASAR
jgi:hypothetical protein